MLTEGSDDGTLRLRAEAVRRRRRASASSSTAAVSPPRRCSRVWWRGSPRHPRGLCPCRARRAARWWDARAVDPLTPVAHRAPGRLSRCARPSRSRSGGGPGRGARQPMLLAGFSQGASPRHRVSLRRIPRPGQDAVAALTGCRRRRSCGWTIRLRAGRDAGLPSRAATGSIRGSRCPACADAAQSLGTARREALRTRPTLFPGRAHEVSDAEIQGCWTRSWWTSPPDGLRR